MPKKNMTPEERKAFGEKMKKAREAKKSSQEPKQEFQTEPQEQITISRSELEDLKRQILEVKQNFQPQQQMPQFNNQGSLIGIFEKYIIDPDNYPSPVERLMKEPRLKQFAMDQNYYFVWDITTSQYETKDGRNVAEPKFTLELWANKFDENGELVVNNKDEVLRFKVKSLIFHEDPQAAIAIAREQGIDVNEWNDSTIDRTQKAFLDEMRYLRARDWLLDSFFPKPPEALQRIREEVIGNRLVEVRAFSEDANAPTRNFNSLG